MRKQVWKIGLAVSQEEGIKKAVGLSASEMQGTCPMKQQIRSTVTLAITGHLTSLPMLLYPMQLPLDAVD